MKKQANDEETVTVSKKKQSKEAFLGGLIFFCMILFVLAAFGALGYGAFSLWQKNAAEKNDPSIASLQTKPEEMPVAEEEPEKKEETPSENTPSNETLASAKAATVSVLNGGAAKGTASVAADFLKGKGFTKVTAGNTTGDFSGMVVYYDSKSATEAGAVAQVLKEKYPTVMTKPAEASSKETSVSPITVILGK